MFFVHGVSPVHLLGLFCSNPSDIDHVGVVHHLDIQFRGMFLSHFLGLAKNMTNDPKKYGTYGLQWMNQTNGW
jgi:hypothetical protein